MSTVQRQTVSASSTSRAEPFSALRRLPRRTLLVVAALILIAGGMFLKWDLLVAAGVAPLILGLLPCAAMCALGLCMSRMGGKGDCAKTKNEDVSSKTEDASSKTGVRNA
jgi:hypothetical protein